MLTEIAAGYWVALIFQASHVVSEVGWVNQITEAPATTLFMLESKLTKATVL